MKKITGEKVTEYVLILTISAVLILIGNMINTISDKNPDTFVSVLAGVPGILILLAIALVGSILGTIFPKVPTAIWITVIGVLLAMPYNTVTAPFVVAEVNKIGLLPTCTPILAYAGVSIGKDWTEFKRIGWRGILVAIFVMIGTYVGSALIAQLILSMQGII